MHQDTIINSPSAQVLENSGYAYIARRVQRAASRDHARRDILERMESALVYAMHHAQDLPTYATHVTHADAWRQERDDITRFDGDYPTSLPWALVRVERITLFGTSRLVTDLEAIGEIEVTYNAAGHRAIYGVYLDGSVRLWMD